MSLKRFHPVFPSLSHSGVTVRTTGTQTEATDLIQFALNGPESKANTELLITAHILIHGPCVKEREWVTVSHFTAEVTLKEQFKRQNGAERPKTNVIGTL